MHAGELTSADSNLGNVLSLRLCFDPASSPVVQVHSLHAKQVACQPPVLFSVHCLNHASAACCLAAVGDGGADAGPGLNRALQAANNSALEAAFASKTYAIGQTLKKGRGCRISSQPGACGGFGALLAAPHASLCVTR